ncbi:MAG: hypothetical protein AB1768_10165 [Pseudomonadota bacterium]|jgi:predicted transcriptional regulator
MTAVTVLSLPLGVSRRIEKLAKEAGRTPAQMLKFVIRDGLEHTEYAVREANAGLAELETGKRIPLEQIRKHIEARRKQRARAVR